MQLNLLFVVSMLFIISPSFGNVSDWVESGYPEYEYADYADGYYYDDSDRPTISDSAEVLLDPAEDQSSGPDSPPPPPTVQSCCPPGSSLRLKNVKGGGYSAKCINTTRSNVDDSLDVTHYLVKSGHKLPECSRGMQVQRVGIKKLTITTNTTTTTTTTTTSAPQIAYKASCLVEEETDYPGMDLSYRGNTDSAMECRAECNKRAECKYFSWVSNGYGWNCWLKTGISRKDVQIGITSGEACRPELPPCVLEVDTDYPGMDLKGVSRESALECRDACNENSKCKYFSWKSSTNECWLKTGISRKDGLRGITSGSACREEISSVREPEPVIEEKQYKATLSNSGVLDVADKKFELGTFCLETTWDEWDSNEKDFKLHSLEEEATTLTCDMCKEKALCNYLRMFYDENYVNNVQMSNTKYMVRVLIGDFNNFDEFKTLVETFITNIWNIFDSDEDGLLTEIIMHPEVKVHLHFLMKITDFLFDKSDYDWDEVISVLDWYELTGKKGKDKIVGRKLISLPSPIYKLYTLMDEDRNESLSLEEIHNFLKITFALIDRNEDCVIDLRETIVALDEAKLPNEFQLGLKILAKQQLSIVNHALNRFFEVADANHDKVTDLKEILNFSNYDFIESEAKDILKLSSPNMKVVHYLNGDSSEYAESFVKRDVVWLEALQNILMNQAYETKAINIKCA